MFADKVLYNGRIWTQHAVQPVVTAVAICGNRVVGLGPDDEMLAILAPGGEKLDLAKRLVLPGLVDAHVHLSWYAHAMHYPDLTNAASATDAAKIAAVFADKTKPGGWVRGRGWAQDKWPNRTFPTASELDAEIPDHPAYLVAQSGHAAWVNTAALKMAGISSETPDPPGGKIGRDASGRPSGVLFETAMELVSRSLPDPTPEVVAEQVRQAIAYSHKQGLIGVHDFDGALAFKAYQMLEERGDLDFRIVKNIPVALLDHVVELGLRWGFGSDFLRIGGIKIFADGALGPHTAWMVEPYEGEPDNYGICTTDPEEMMEKVSAASAAGLPSTIHAIGDKAVHEVLNVYEFVRRQESERNTPPSAIRHRIEHVQIIHPADVPRLGQLGVVASMQPNHATSDMLMAERSWGNRSDYAYNWRLQLDAGAMLALGSDAPIEPIAPLPNIQAAVTRRREDGTPGEEGWRSGEGMRNCLTVAEAVHGFTVGAAYAAGTEKFMGRLAPGYLADLVILEKDIFTCHPMEIGNTRVLGTMIDGVWVYREIA